MTAGLAWPDGARSAVTLTFDVDGEAGWLGGSASYGERLSSLSDGRFGVVRGLERICSLLAENALRATFYVPGDTAERYPSQIAALAAAGHEIGHHGHMHLRSHALDERAQRDEIVRGISALESCTGKRPAGYRSPFWEVTPATFALLVEYGFTHDSSFMGDDRPYLETLDGLSMLEFPVHWFLDDWPHFSWSNERGGQFADRGSVVDSWLDELDSARAEGRTVTYTMHPEVVGRASHIVVLKRLVDEITRRGDVWIATHQRIASHLREQGVLAP